MTRRGDGTAPSLQGLVALVTGSTRGIGRAIAEGMRAAGAEVIIHGRSDVGARAVADQLGASWVAADLSSPEQVSRMVADLNARQIDVLVNNAAVELGGTLENTSQDDLREAFQVNVFAPVEIVRGLLPNLRRSSRPSVLFISSIHESVPYYGNGAYAASKAALAMYLKTLALELGPEGIRVNSIAPGAIATDINREVIASIGEDRFSRWIPLGRVGHVWEIGDVAVFLSSESASYVHGATVTVDGAYSHHLVRYRAPSHR